MEEVQALLEGLILTKKLGYLKVYVEGDSFLVINACIQRKTLNWRINYILGQVWNLLDSFEAFHISHTYKEGNKMADILVNMGCDGLEIELIKDEHDLTEFPLLKNILCDEISCVTRLHV